MSTADRIAEALARAEARWEALMAAQEADKDGSPTTRAAELARAHGIALGLTRALRIAEREESRQTWREIHGPGFSP